MNPLIIAFGFLGQALFGSRFIVQWVVSESRKESVIPYSFWVLSLLGGVILLIYALLRRDVVFSVGQAAGLIVYTRNLVLIHRRRGAPVAPASPAVP
jgi:lipid-A-disaccharide synthase-like uncharacterized protein